MRFGMSSVYHSARGGQRATPYTQQDPQDTALEDSRHHALHGASTPPNPIHELRDGLPLNISNQVAREPRAWLARGQILPQDEKRQGCEPMTGLGDDRPI